MSSPVVAIDPPTLVARAWLRAMNPSRGEGGGSEPHLFQTDEGPYMVKVKNNPQSPRVLVNELLGGICLDWLIVRHPRPAIVDVPQSVIDDSPGAKFNNGTALVSGLAFGSEYWQSDPGGAVDSALITNTDDVAGTSVYDTWVHQHDARQFRIRASQDEPGRYEFVPVDQGHSFGNPDWTTASLDTDRVVPVAGAAVAVADSEVVTHIERLRGFSDDIASKIEASVPSEWLDTAERTAVRVYLTQRAVLAADALEVHHQGGGP
jgi:hypothetical protein